MRDARASASVASASEKNREKLKEVVHFLVRFHENRPFERSKLLTFFLRAGAPGGAKIPTSQFVVCKLAPNNQPGKPGNRYDVVAAHPSKNWKKWFIFHWDFTKIDPLNKANC